MFLFRNQIRQTCMLSSLDKWGHSLGSEETKVRSPALGSLLKNLEFLVRFFTELLVGSLLKCCCNQDCGLGYGVSRVLRPGFLVRQGWELCSAVGKVMN